MSIRVCYGPMFAGKTTKLQEEIKNCENSNKLILKPLIDVRYSQTGIVTHNGQSVDAKTVKDLDVDTLLKNENGEWIPSGYIFIDEGHMFGESLIRFAVIARTKGHHVYVAGVEKVFDGSDFYNMSYLISIADETIYIQGTCGKCNNKSVYSNLKQIPEKLSRQIIVGGAELYEPLCEECFSSKNKQL